MRGTTYDVRAVNRDGGADTLPAAFQAVSPSVSRVNGVTKPTGLIGMTVLIEGDAFGDYHHGKVFFAGSGGTPIQAIIADTLNDWTNNYVVTTVPAGTSNASQITVQTATGTSSTISFNLISGATFSPSAITWTQTSALPQPLQGLGAAFVPPANVASTRKTMSSSSAARRTRRTSPRPTVYRAQAQQSGALSAWAPATNPLPVPRAYHATVAATAYTAALDTTTTEAYLYAIGGIDGSRRDGQHRVLLEGRVDGSNGVWQTTTPLPAAVHSAGAVVFRGYMYVTGGADGQNAPTSTALRAAVNADGTLGAWQPIAALPGGAAYQSLINFGPYLYAIGGDGSTVAPCRGRRRAARCRRPISRA